MILEGMLGRSAWPFLCRTGARLIAAIGCVAAEISRSGAAASAELDALRAQNGLRFEGLGFFCSPLRLHMNAVTSAINNARPVIGMINPSVSIGKLLPGRQRRTMSLLSPPHLIKINCPRGR
jgi:hypothetical protein